MEKPVVLITGALTGIGRATAFAFADSGARLVVSGRRDAEGRALEAELRERGADAVFVRADVRDEDDVRRLVDRAVERFGRLDAAVNNAGTEGRPGPVVEQSAGSYAATFDTNVLGTLLSMKHELRVMQAQKHGSIVNVSSTYGHEGAAFASVYAGSKHAVEGITKSAALEAASSGVRVNAVAPGPTDTGMLDRFTGSAERKAGLAAQVPLGRVGRPDEVARAIVFVASDAASFISGQIISVDGAKSAG
ncbi:SDR family NAD(P)-dependent oxidoreductase [Paraburkholderia caballeronis]|uniref:SDR family NAD(P)-dependent oxidoreductase n=1 Tax=Paraburkholderia caballeronis TaxID=416943 RepID=UPI001066489D|nr:glucose 1-dehydrogenase [Paraburkholderia caballeronis]TDV07141.1 NAD(P)-dependent dehydrogenase (short-subunit alcohol dehydrogenase family) [Paraburkholderia caballeronis]TDV11285.1 NAD(P)-dependent dehydrogenase (short-subunit alcohol dehydrogenase family) [Paraburkholderia caballeronis]TDV22470.1 NAD(P)-dependent dehydrogenase (short-subunit alcohol dehydrogenase family) [Paraburkholderia caballeronis]TDV25573.1 NAD(P)-dependent dehydrogenase (short-subunit alcohol dehydrogenase family) 